VLGPVADPGMDLLEDDGRDEPGPGAVRTARADDEPDADLGAATPQDAVPRAADVARRTTWLDEVPSRVRSAVPLAVAAVAGALLGGLVGSGTAEHSELVDRRETVRMLATLMVPYTGVTRGDERGLRLRLVLLNAGPEPVTVTEARFDGSRTSVRIDNSVEVPPGRTAGVAASVLPDCRSGGSRELRLLVTTVDGQTRDVAAGSFGRGVGMTPDELARFCGPQLGLEPVPVWRTTTEPDGSLFLQLRNVRDEPVLLDVTGPPGTTIVGDPPLPAQLPTDRSAVVRLRVQVERCTSAAQRANAGDEVDLRINGTPGLAFPDASTVVGWFAQQVAAACPRG
jgi:hypothetical protein